MLVDSHCHLNMLDLEPFNHSMHEVIRQARENGVRQFLCVSVEFVDHLTLSKMADDFPEVFFSVGVHPTGEHRAEYGAQTLASLASQYDKCIALGETGLDYYRNTEAAFIERQQQAFRNHIKAAIQSGKPLIIHTRSAAEDTLRIMKEENAEIIGGVMHCFSEDWSIAQRAMDLNFYISFSGIVTFKNAKILHEVAAKVPSDRLLIETDSPYLAPMPFRGKQNHPALVKYVAEGLSVLRNVPFQTIAQQSSDNFRRCFRLPEVDIN